MIPNQRSSISDGPKSEPFDLTLSPPMSRDLSKGKSVLSSTVEPARLQDLNEPVTQVVSAKKSTTTKSKNTAKNKVPPPKRQTRASTKRRKLTNEGSDDGEIQQLEKMAGRFLKS
jgi:hypothetical protein